MNLCGIFSAALAVLAIVLLIVVCAADNSVALGDTIEVDLLGSKVRLSANDVGLFEVSGAGSPTKPKDFSGKIGETFQAAQAFTIMAILLFAAAAVLALAMPKAGAGAHLVAALFSVIAGSLIIATLYVEDGDRKLDDTYGLSYGGFLAFFCAILGCVGCCLAMIAARQSPAREPNQPDGDVVVTGEPVAGDAEKPM